MNVRTILKSSIKNLAATLIGLLLAVLVSEVLLGFIIPPPLRYLSPQARHRPDPELGWLPMPNARG